MDAVILWPGGQSPSKRDAARRQMKELRSPRGRFSWQADELSLCICSILRNLEFVDRIFVVPLAERPRLERIRDKLFPGSKVHVVNLPLKDLFAGRKEYLPCHNPSTAAALLNFLPELDERYLLVPYDCITVRQLAYSDFHTGGRPVLRDCRKQKVPSALVQSLFRERYSCHYRQIHTAKTAGSHFYYTPCEVPVVMDKKMLSTFYCEQGLLLQKQLQARYPGRGDIDPVTLGAVLAGDNLLLMDGKARLLLGADTDLQVIENIRRLREENVLFCTLPYLPGLPPERKRAITDWVAETLAVRLS